MKFKNTEVYGFKSALRGMRNPLESWNKSDSRFNLYCTDCDQQDIDISMCKRCQLRSEHGWFIGNDDLKLAQKLIRAGSEHRKFMRQIMVSVDITAPLYWWKEFDTYKVGTTANSTSTMHKLASTPITLDCFEIDDFNSDLIIGTNNDLTLKCIQNYIDSMEELRKRYLETKDKAYWKELIRWLPSSWNQTRTVTMTYENLIAMCSKGQRRFHKLNEWSGIDNSDVPNFISWARTLPYAQELIFIDELEDKQEETKI